MALMPFEGFALSVHGIGGFNQKVWFILSRYVFLLFMGLKIFLSLFLSHQEQLDHLWVPAIISLQLQREI
jgi:hypothetical protein